jgi:hypothetical protein
VRVPHAIQARHALDVQVQELLTKGAITVITDLSPGFYCKIFVVPKKEPDAWRLITDLSPLNAFIVCPRFRMDTAQMLRTALRGGMWAVRVDIQDAYLHVPVAIGRRPFLRFFYREVHYQWAVLPFGLNVSPRIFTKLFRVVAAYFRNLGVHCHVFIDDWLFFHEEVGELRRLVPLIVNLFSRLGVGINFPKSTLMPVQVFEHLGIAFDLVRGLSFPSQATMSILLRLRAELLAANVLSPRALMRWVGYLVTVMCHVRWGRAHVHVFVHHLNVHFFSQPVTFTLPIDRRALRVLLDTPMPLPPLLKEAALWWTSRRLLEGRPLGVPVFRFVLGTDASLQGWGAHLSEGLTRWTISGHWEPTDLPHINVLEFRAVFLAVQHWVSRLVDSVVLLPTDNTTVMAYVNHLGGTRSLTMSREAVPFAQFLEDHRIELAASFVPGVQNVLADQLSRSQGPLSTEWRLAPRVVQLLFRKWGTPSIDLFASAVNAQLPRFCSLRPDPEAMVRDAFSLEWGDQFLYLFPPFNPRFLLRVMVKVAASPGMSAILVAPRHPNAMYYSWIRRFSAVEPFPLPIYPDLLTQGPHQHPGLLGLHLHAFLLCVPR